MLPCSLFTECHKVNQIQKLCSNPVITRGVGGSHTDTQDLCGLHEHPQCPLLETRKETSSLTRVNGEQECRLRVQVSALIKNDILSLPVIASPCDRDPLWDTGVEPDRMV